MKIADPLNYNNSMRYLAKSCDQFLSQNTKSGSRSSIVCITRSYSHQVKKIVPKSQQQRKRARGLMRQLKQYADERRRDFQFSHLSSPNYRILCHVKTCLTNWYLNQYSKLQLSKMLQPQKFEFPIAAQKWQEACPT